MANDARQMTNARLLAWMKCEQIGNFTSGQWEHSLLALYILHNKGICWWKHCCTCWSCFCRDVLQCAPTVQAAARGARPTIAPSVLSVTSDSCATLTTSTASVSHVTFVVVLLICYHSGKFRWPSSHEFFSCPFIIPLLQNRRVIFTTCLQNCYLRNASGDTWNCYWHVA